LHQDELAGQHVSRQFFARPLQQEVTHDGQNASAGTTTSDQDDQGQITSDFRQVAIGLVHHDGSSGGNLTQKR